MAKKSKSVTEKSVTDTGGGPDIKFRLEIKKHEWRRELVANLSSVMLSRVQFNSATNCFEMDIPAPAILKAVVEDMLTDYGLGSFATEPESLVVSIDPDGNLILEVSA